VYRIDTAGRTLKRIDKSFGFGNNHYARQFVRNDTLYSFGGSGLWTINTVLLYFDESTLRWGAYGEASPFPMHAHSVQLDRGDFLKTFSYYDRVHDQFYYYEGSQIWQFHFAQKHWTVAGNRAQTLQVPITSLAMLTDSTLGFREDVTYYEIDLFHNTFYTVQTPQRVELTEPYHLLPWVVHFPHTDGVLTLTDEVLNGEGLPVVLNWNYRKEMRKELGVFYHSPNRPYYYGAGALVLLAVLIWWGRKVQKTNEHHSYEEHDASSLYPEQIKVLQALLNGTLNANDLNALLNLDQQTFEVQRRRRSELIKTLNTLGKGWFGMNLVERSKDPLDRRAVQYQLNPEMGDDMVTFLRSKVN
jgi:DNA-binding MarR family transcriptional regulator